MKKLDKTLKAHLFICCRQRDQKACCSEKGAEDMVEELKFWVKSHNLKRQIKVSKSSCLGECETGITACLYPKNLWFHKMTPSDIPQLQKILLEEAYT